MVERVDMDTNRMVREPVAAVVVGALSSGFVGRGFFGRELTGRKLVGRRLRRRRFLYQLGDGWRSRLGFGARRWRRPLALVQHQLMKLPDQIDVVSRRLAFVGFEAFENGLDPVDGAKDEGDGLGRDRHAVAEFAHQAFGSVREGLQPGQTEKAAGALDGMDEPKDVAEDVAVIRLLLEAHQLRIDAFETLVGLGQELLEQVVHLRRLLRTTHFRRSALVAPPPRPQDARARCQAPRHPVGFKISVLPKRLISVART